MKKPQCIHTIRFLLVVLIMFSCTERIEIELGSSDIRLVVYGEITNQQKAHQIFLSSTSDYFSNKPAVGISGAEVRISDGNHDLICPESEYFPGLYQTSALFAGSIGKTYKLTIENVDVDKDGKMESYSATSFLPPVSTVDSIKLSYLSRSYISGWQVHLYALDPAERKDFYAFKIYKNDTLLTDSLSEYYFQSDELFNGKYTNGIIAQFLNDSKPDEKASKGDKITFELNGITKEYYDFLTEAQFEISTKIPLFSGPPANVKSNISNNAVGFFTAYSVSKSSAIIPK